MAQSVDHTISVHGHVTFGNQQVKAYIVVNLGELDHLTAFQARKEIERRLQDSVEPTGVKVNHIDTIDAMLQERRQLPWAHGGGEHDDPSEATLTEKFNAHLKDTVVIFVEDKFFAGDPRPTTTAEPEGLTYQEPPDEQCDTCLHWGYHCICPQP